MKRLSPQQWAGGFLIGYAAAMFISWSMFVHVTSPLGDKPMVRLLNQFSSSDPSKHPLFTQAAVILAALSLLLAVPFFLKSAKRKNIAMMLTLLVVMHALATLVFIGAPAFAYLVPVCLIAFHGYQTALPNS